MGAGTRVKQYQRRFGLGQPVDTYGEPCPHAKAATLEKEAAEASFRGKAIEGKNLRVELPNSFAKTTAQKGVVQVELTDPMTGEARSFYKALRPADNPEVNIPRKIMDRFEPGREIVLKIKPLPLQKFIERLGGEASKIVRLKGDGHVTINLGGKEFAMKLEDLKYDYANNAGGQGGSAYVEFVVNDISGKAWKFRLYDNGMGESRLVVDYGNRLRPIEEMSYDARRDAVSVEYHDSGGNREIKLLFREPPDEIDLDAGMAPKEMIDEVNDALKARDTVKLGEIGEKIAAKFAKEKLKATVFQKDGNIGPDRRIILDGELGIIESKFTTNKKINLNIKLVEAKDQIRNRRKENREYRFGIAFATYFNKDNGYFDYSYEKVELNRYEGE
ncbi:MAG: hypothetical protein JTT11_09215 [Candidatus Brockarchaeota archaeon]|nr:hypothetical protein [Candidatus Brockarchaeota archaeon]